MTIPENCMPVVEVLRRDVPRPDATKLVAETYGSFCRFPPNYCPLGLHPTALRSCPAGETVFLPGPLSFSTVVGEDHPTLVFANWWDSLTLEQAKEAVNLIWPEEV